MATQPIEAEQPAADAPAVADSTVSETLYANDQQQPGEGDPQNPNADPADPQDPDNPADTDPAPAVDPPNSWSAEDREIFKALTPEAQAVIARREAERDRQIYAKGQETRQVEAQAREAVLKINNNYATQIQALLAGGEPPERPDPRLLATGQEEHRALFYQQEAQFRSWESQQHALQTHLDQLNSHARALEEQHVAAQRQQDEALLSQELGDIWSEPSKRQKFLSDLEPIGGELGYSRELMAQANATDILALKKALDWKAKAARWDDLQKRKMTDVRSHRGQPPKLTQPGIANGGAQPPQNTAAILYPNDVRR